MAKTKLRRFPTHDPDEVNVFLGRPNITYVGLKVISGRRMTDASLLLIYEEDETSLDRAVKGGSEEAVKTFTSVSNSSIAIGRIATLASKCKDIFDDALSHFKPESIGQLPPPT